MKTTIQTDAQLNDAVRRKHKQYYDAIDAALKAGLDVKNNSGTFQTTVVKPDGTLTAPGNDAYRVAVRPALTLTRTFQ